MTGRIAASADDTPGQARIKVTEAAQTPEARLRIRRDGWDAGVLGPQGWQAGDVLLRPSSCRVDGRDLVLLLGPDVTRHLERGVYLMSVPEARIEEEAVVWPDILDPFGGRRMKPVLVTATTDDVVKAPDDTIGTPTDGSAIIDGRGLQQQKTMPVRKGLWPLLLGGTAVLILLLGGAAILYRAWHHSEPTPAKKVAMAPQKPTSPVSPSPTPPPIKKTVTDLPKPPTPLTPQPQPQPQPMLPPSLADLSVNDAIAQALNRDAIFNEGERRLNGTQKDDGLLLIEAAADKGDPKAMLALARLYDPVNFDPHGPIPTPDLRESAEYFRQAVKAGSQEAVAPRMALQTYLQTQAQRGNLEARLTLQDFWP